MAIRTLRSWRAAPGTLALVAVFAVAAGVGIPLVAWFIHLRQGSVLVPALLLALALGALVYAWRFGLHPRLTADADGVTVRNPRRRQSFPWDEIAVLAPGPNGLVVASADTGIEAWCVQKSNWAARRGRATRADDVVTELAELQDFYDPPLQDEETGISLRRARSHEAGLLTELERASNEVALAHVFPPQRFAFPVDDVRRRWQEVLLDPLVAVRVLEVDEEPVGFVAFEPTGTVRHLAVVPDQMRRGHGSLLLEYACEEIFDAMSREAQLWVLTDNSVARAFYRAHGWRETEDRSRSEFPPHPEEQRMVKPNPSLPRRSR